MFRAVTASMVWTGVRARRVLREATGRPGLMAVLGSPELSALRGLQVRQGLRASPDLQVPRASRALQVRTAVTGRRARRGIRCRPLRMTRTLLSAGRMVRRIRMSRVVILRLRVRWIRSAACTRRCPVGFPAGYSHARGLGWEIALRLPAK